MPETTTPSSCVSQSPFVTLSSTQTPLELDYKLPLSTSFVANVYLPVKIAGSAFNTGPGFDSPPTDNYFSIVSSLDATTLTARLSNNLVSVGAPNSVNLTSQNETISVNVSPQLNLASSICVEGGSSTSSPIVDFSIAGQPVSSIAAQALHSMPVTVVDMMGNHNIEYRQEPEAPEPSLTIVEHYRVNTYAGKYGAGETVKTFSLLPGEKTTISIKTYKQTVSNKKVTENVLDSLTDDSAKDLENQISIDANRAYTDNESNNKSKSIGGGVNIPFMKSGGLKLSGDSSKSSTFNSVRSASIKLLNSAVSKQVQKSVSTRKVEVNTEVTVSETSSEEVTITRVLENINKSRVLNFVFRQLNQELITITYLDDISFVYTNGYEESKRVVKIDELYDLLKDIIAVPADVDTIFKDIVDQLFSVYDYAGTRQIFLEKRTENTYDSDTGAVKDTEDYFRKNSSLSMTYGDFTVNGIIKNITSRIMPTDSVVVDALLGQGEALDCFNMHMQDAETIRVQLENQKTEQAIEVIDAQSTAADKADKYKKVFGSCCETAQTEIVS